MSSRTFIVCTLYIIDDESAKLRMVCHDCAKRYQDQDKNNSDKIVNIISTVRELKEDVEIKFCHECGSSLISFHHDVGVVPQQDIYDI